MAANRRAHPVFWLIGVSLALIAARLWLESAEWAGRGSTAFAQTGAGGGRGIFAVAGEIGRDAFGLYMVDMDSMNVWCYEYQKERNCLSLVAARSFRYDRYLENYNSCDLPPAAVRDMVEKQRAYRLEQETPGSGMDDVRP